eukprot:COSAG02_NODE_7050_length_3209_cov_4.365595_2_plen_284_part_00
MVITGPLAVLLFLHAPWMPGRSGMFDYALRQYSKGTKRPLGPGTRKMVRGPSVFFDSEEFRAISSGLDPRASNEPETVWAKYQECCKRHAVLTKAVTAAVLATLGDILIQYLRTRDQRRELAKLSVEALLELRPSLGTGLFPLHKPLQTAAFALHGLVLAPLGHVWYAVLEKLTGGAGGASGLVLRLVLDRLIYDPLQLFATIVILGKSIGPSPATVLSALANPSASTVFWVSLVANWRVWLPSQLLNYALVPPHMRVLFGNGVSIVWNCAMALRFATGLTDA